MLKLLIAMRLASSIDRLQALKGLPKFKASLRDDTKYSVERAALQSK